MSTMVEYYLEQLTNFYKAIQQSQPFQEDIDKYNDNIKDDFDHYKHTLVNAGDNFQLQNGDKYPVPNPFGLKSTLSSEHFVESVVESRKLTTRLFFKRLVYNLQTEEDVRTLYKDTVDEFPDIHKPSRLAMYSLYTRNICTVDDITIPIFNDPTISGFVELANKRTRKLKEADTAETYHFLIHSYLLDKGSENK